jgi:hypothetical protein
MRILCAGVCVMACLATAGFGQVFYGTLLGTVEDADGAVIPGAVVTVTDAATGQTRQTVANDTGAYQLSNTPPGAYTLTVEAKGFSRFTQTKVHVTINTVTRVDVRLQVGALVETISVVGSAAMLQTDKADVHVELGSKEINELPLPAYRNYQSLINLVPGATPGRFQNTIFGSPGRALSTNVNGTNRNNNNTRLDGAMNIRPSLPHQTRYVPPAESIETVNISTNSFDAEQGFAGGAAIAITTKSGTNQTHGVLFEHHSNGQLKAKDFFFLDEKRPKRIMNQFGGTLGGPIKKDKLFYFLSWERLRERENFAKLVTVATADQRAGDFSRYGVTIYDPLTGNTDGSGRVPFANAVIPENRQSAITRKMQALVPLPTLAGTAANYFASAPVKLDRDNYDLKINWNPNSATVIWGKYSALEADSAGAYSLGPAGGSGLTSGGGVGTGDFLAQMGTIGYSHTFNPNMVMDGTLGFGRDSTTNTADDYGTNFGLDVLGIPGTNGFNKEIGASGMPLFSIAGYETLGGGYNWMPQFEADEDWTITNNVGLVKGRHDMRFGVDIARFRTEAWKPEAGQGPRGGFVFNNGITAIRNGPSPNQFNNYAAFLLGLPFSAGKSIQFYDPMAASQWLYGLYFRDRWQATRSLTLSLGLRWEYYPLYFRSKSGIANTGIELYDPDTNQVFIGGMGNVPRNAGVETDKNLFAPRAGIAYRVGQHSVIRAGYGISIDPQPLVRTNRQNYPSVVAADFPGANTFQPYGSIEQGIPLFGGPDISSGVIPMPPSVSTSTLSRGPFRRGYIQSFNVAVERELPGDFVATVAYVGTRTIRQRTGININAAPAGGGQAGQPLFVQWGRNAATTVQANFQGGNYNALQAQLDRRFSAGLMVKTSYTYSKAINWTDDAAGGLFFAHPSVWSRNRATAGFDRTHMLRVAWLADLPFGSGRRWAGGNAISRAVLSGWQVNGIFSAYSGLPFTVTSSATSLNAPGNSQTADQVKAEVVKLGGIGRDVPFFDPLAFRPVTEARFGTAGRNILRGPGVVSLDGGLFRNFRLTERWRLQFRAEGFNLSNTPHFDIPNTNASNMSLNPDGTIRSLGNFMSITSTAARESNAEGGAREFRFGMRLNF